MPINLRNYEEQPLNSSAKKIQTLNSSFATSMQNKAVIADHTKTVYQDVIQKELKHQKLSRSSNRSRGVGSGIGGNSNIASIVANNFRGQSTMISTEIGPLVKRTNNNTGVRQSKDEWRPGGSNT